MPEPSSLSYPNRPRCEVVDMNAISSARAQVETADGLGTVFGAAWVAFEIIRLAADGVAGQDTEWVLTWTALIPPACEGRDAIGFAPSVPSGEAITIDLSDLAQTPEDQVMRLVRELATACAAKLRGLIAGPVSADATAAARALVAAEEIRTTLRESG
jgi:hypothetical protein